VKLLSLSEPLHSTMTLFYRVFILCNIFLKMDNCNRRVGWKNSLSQKLRKMFLKFTIAVLSINFIDFHEICKIVYEWHWESILQISWKSMRQMLSTAMVNCRNIFPNFLLRLLFHLTLQFILLSVIYLFIIIIFSIKFWNPFWFSLKLLCDHTKRSQESVE